MTTPLIERRRIEAETLAAVYNELAHARDEHFALDTVARTVSAIAYQAGREFARKAPNGPNLRHFAGIVDVWNGSGNLDVRDVKLEGDSLSLTVARCAYAELYREMGLPQELIPVLSCTRDAPFARGYSKHLRFFRENTIAEGASHCDFLFRWEDD